MIIYISMAEPSGNDFLRCLTMAMDWQPGPFGQIKGILTENFVFLNLWDRIENRNEIARIAPWFASREKTKGELDFYVRSLRDCKNYGIEVILLQRPQGCF